MTIVYFINKYVEKRWDNGMLSDAVSEDISRFYTYNYKFVKSFNLPKLQFPSLKNENILPFYCYN